jgi:ABC-type lipoprotein release transport system permease subunit
MTTQNLPAFAWRNLWRNRRRTLLTLFSIIFGVFLAIMFTALQDRNWADMIDLAARLGGGHITIQHEEYRDTPSLKKSILESTRMASIALKQAGVSKVTQRISGPVMLNTTSESYGASFIAFDPANEDQTTLSLLDPEALLTGKMFVTDDEKGIILGYKLAENLGASLGSRVVYTMTDKSGEIVSGLARLSGTIKTGAPRLDASLSLLPLNSIRKIIGYAPDEATQISVFIKDQRASGAVAERLDSAISTPGIAVLPWYLSQPELSAFIAMKVGGSRFMSAFIALLVAAGIFNTLFVSVMERMREFGILMAIGFTPMRLFSLVMLESFWLALVGLAGAAAVTIGPYMYLASAGIDISQILAEQGTIDIAGVAMSTTLKVGIFPESITMIAVAALVATLLAGLYPAWRASSVEPVDAIKLV